ncbi:hypothetical protein CRI94_03325 [Longibacter salinarum]|uniref:Fibronectin type-III domain-containing protein n=1 Tax=Longibacter salinarum TaxID=1850348 RepID=A0A2A8D2Y3_9BACT|nr:Calx-beta domain-containing protein [Longibacter salinarum]PEN15322.1 hypothetical protein CRI94_03325 [Longibacter salinarum]
MYNINSLTGRSVYQQLPILIAVILLVALPSTPAVAQTGPGGVGNSGDNVLWLRADRGIADADGTTLTDWADQSGNANAPTSINGDPTYREGVLNGLPVVEFDGDDVLNMVSGLDGLSNSDNTIITVSRRTGAIEGQEQFLWNQGERVLGYEVKAGPNYFNFLSASGSRGQGGPNGTTRATSSASGATSFNVISSMVDTGSGEVDLVINGSVNTGGGGSVGVTGASIGNGLIGDVAEVIVFNRSLNAAELRSVYTYLAEKYSITIDTDLFTDATYRFDLAGIGAAGDVIGVAALGDHLAAQSSDLRVSSSSFGSGRFAFIGHDGKTPAFSNQERPNGDGSVQKTLREWRVDLTNTSTASLTISGDLSGSLGSYDDFAVFIDRDGDFSNGAAFYDLDENTTTGLYESDPITINDGDYIALARIQRTISFAESDNSGFEGDSGSTAPTIPLKLNYPNRTPLTVDVRVTSGANGPIQGADYETCCASTSPLTVPGGVTTFNLNDPSVAPSAPEPVAVVGDATEENNTEFVTVDLLNLSTSGDFLRAGDVSSFNYGIIDDDGTLPRATVSMGASSIIENGGAASATVSLSEAAAGGETIYYEFSGEATPGEDFDPSSPDGSVTFSSGENDKTINITALDDALYEGTEEVVITLVAAENGATLYGSGGTLPSAFVSITDDETAPTVEFAASSFIGTEGENATVTVQLSDVVGTNVSVEFDLPPDPGNDFSPITTSPVTIPAGQTTASILIAVNDDATVEFNETVTLTLSNPSGATVGAQSRADLRLIDNDRIGPHGPGGVGDRDNLAVWLDASSLNLANGDPVDTWSDRSGNSNDAVGEGASPTFTASTSVFDTRPSVSFRGAQYLAVPSLTNIAASENTLFAAASTTADADQTILSVLFTDGDPGNQIQVREVGYDDQGGGVSVFSTQAGNEVQIGGESTGDLQIFDSKFSGGLVDFRVNVGGIDNTSSGPISGTNAIIGARIEEATGGGGGNGNGNGNGNRKSGNPNTVDLTRTQFLDGELGDLIAYRASLNEAQRTIVSNYLTAKYALGNVDEYTGDTDYGYGGDVLGVGFVDANNDGPDPEEVHAGAELGGIRLDDIGGLDTSGDFLFAGHGTPDTENFVATSDLETYGSLTLVSRMQRAWYIDRNDDGGSAITVDVTFNLSDAGLGSDPAQDIGLPSNYVLISCSDDPNDNNGCSTNWIEEATAAGVEGDAITFADVKLQDGRFYTIGSSDRAVSPLLTLSLVIEGSVGNEGNAVTGTKGGDAGWRMIGAPLETESGGSITAGDLKSDSDPALIEFNLPSAMFYTWDESSQSFSTGSPATPLVNGRGAMLYLFDDLGTDDADPIDPSLVIQPTKGEPTGQSEVTVGIDDPLPTGPVGTTHFLANPYPYNFDISTMTAGGNAFTNSFQADVQAWDPYSSGTDANGNTGSYTLLSTTTSTVIGAWQGFFVDRNGSGVDQSVTFPLSGRVFGDTKPILGASKHSASSPPKRIELRLIAQETDGNVVAYDKAAWIRFTDRSSTDWDVFDAAKYTPLASRYVTLAPLGRLHDGSVGPKAVESLPIPDDPVTVDLQVLSQGVSARLDIHVAATQNIPDSWIIELIDTKGTADTSDDGVKRLDRPDARWKMNEAATSPELTFSTDKSLSSTTGASVEALHLRLSNNDRQSTPEIVPLSETVDTSPVASKASLDTSRVPAYRLRITPKDAPAPVEIASFTGHQTEENIVLEWSTKSEVKDTGFEVQVKPDGASSFRSVGFVNGQTAKSEGSAYAFTVEEELAYGEHSFRLRQVNVDGSTSYSKTIPVEKTLDRAYKLSKTAPNPVTARATMDLTVRSKQNVRITMFDLLGRRVATVHDGPLEPNRTKSMTIDASQLSSGVYFIRVTGDSFSETRRMTVVR